MMQTLQRAVAKLLLLVYVPLTLALPLFHHHDMEHGADACVYKAAGESAGHENHSDGCDACKFASSHSLDSSTVWYSVAIGVSLVVVGGTHQPVRTPNTLYSPRAPPVFS